MVLAHDINTTRRTQDIKTNQDVVFDALLLSEKTLQGLNDAGFYKPSPVQLHGIPMGKCGFDLLLEAKSGTGKTIVFTVIALEKLHLQQGLQALMLAPTREIASQICDVIKAVGLQYSGLCVEVVMGGLPLQDDINKFKIGRKVHIVVGSPGRLRHLIQDGYIDASAVRLLVLDEADKLIEKSFQADINYIFSSLPEQKQVVMSSATFSDSAKEFISKYVREPQHICPDSTSILLGIEQKVSLVNTNTNIVKQTYLRYDELIKILTNKDFKQCLIFCNYQARVADLYKLLTRDKWPCEQLYGSQEQTDRLDALKTLQEYKCRILISTDLAARGIDASNVDLVINFEPPYDWQTYLHRIGRAGRYGSYGTAVSIVSIGKEEIKFKEILSIMQGSLNISYFWENTKYVLNNDKGELEKCEELKNENGKPEKIINGGTNGNKECKEPEIGNLYEHDNTEKKINGETHDHIKENSEINVTINGDTNQSMFEYLWGQNNNNIKVEIENFNDLAKSFNDSQSINNFDELLQSLKNHNLSNDGKDFVSPELKKIHIDEEETTKCINCLNTNDENPNQLSQSSSKDAKNATEPIITNVNNVESDKSINLKNLLYAKENIAIKPFNSKQITISDDDGDEIISEEQSEMIRLGLPTSFWTKAEKHAVKQQSTRKIPTRRESHVRIENNPNIDSDNTTKNVISNTIVSERTRLLHTNSKQDHKYAEIAGCSNEQRMYEDTRIANEEFKHTKKSLKSSSKPLEISKPRDQNRAQNYEREPRKVNTNLNTKNTTKKSEKSKKINQNETNQDQYALWYNALKLRTLQWEQIFYMEEISKIM